MFFAVAGDDERRRGSQLSECRALPQGMCRYEPLIYFHLVLWSDVELSSSISFTMSKLWKFSFKCDLSYRMIIV